MFLRRNDLEVYKERPPFVFHPSSELVTCPTQTLCHSIMPVATNTFELARPHVRKWWKDAVVYQVWPTSYSDSNGVSRSNRLP
jgi:hypothetical protein